MSTWRWGAVQLGLLRLPFDLYCFSAKLVIFSSWYKLKQIIQVFHARVFF